MGDYYGYLILGIFAFIFIGISVIVSKKFPAEGVDDFVAAGRGIPSALIAASVMVSWVWTTTLMGSAEAGMNFGISGGLNYAWGNAVPFFILIPMVMHLRKKMPKCTTFTEFIEQRYNRTTSKVFFLFGVGVIIYVLVAQAVGIGIARQQAGRHCTHHAQQKIQVEAEVAPLFFQRAPDEPGEVDAQDDAERPAARKRHEHKGDDPPDLTHQQGRAAQAQIKRDILIDEQFHSIDQDLRTHQDRDEVRDADAAILPLQFG